MIGACDPCLRRTWLLARLAGHLDVVRARVGELLELEDHALIAAVGGRQRAELEAEHADIDPGAIRDAAARAGVEAVCRHSAHYPAALGTLAAPPAVVHAVGDLGRLQETERQPPVAIVGTRRPSPYGAEVAQSLGRGLAAAGLMVVSGLATGIDAAAHTGALEADGAPTIAVVPCGAERAHPHSSRALHQRIRRAGVVLSELPPGTPVRRWMFIARNRLVAALSGMTVVVEAAEGSGALVTAEWARSLNRLVGAVPGRVTSVQAQGPHRLIAAGAHIVQDTQGVLDLLFGAGILEASIEAAAPRSGMPLDEPLRRLVAALGDGRETADALERAGLGLSEGLAALSTLELGGYIRRWPGGRYAVVP